MNNRQNYWHRGKVANDPGILIPDRPIAFNRDFVSLGLGIKGALFLSQAIYWSKRTKYEDGWFYKTIEEWEDETGLTVKEQRGIKNLLVKEGFITVEKRGIPARNFFQVDLDEIADALITRQIRQKGSTGDAEMAGHSISESTTEILDFSSKNPTLEIVKVNKEGEEIKPKEKKKADPAWGLYNHCVGLLSKEAEFKIETSAWDFKAVKRALKSLGTDKHVIYLVEDLISNYKAHKTGYSLSKMLSPSELNKYKYENQL